jgi:hypothetical protein
MTKRAFDTTNTGLVAAAGERIRVMNTSHLLDMSKEDALMVAAWLAVISEADDETLLAAKHAVEST